MSETKDAKIYALNVLDINGAITASLSLVILRCKDGLKLVASVHIGNKAETSLQLHFVQGWFCMLRCI
jgi:hypothetical protein